MVDGLINPGLSWGGVLRGAARHPPGVSWTTTIVLPFKCLTNFDLHAGLGPCGIRDIILQFEP